MIADSHCFIIHLSLLITAAAAQFGGQVLETELWCVAMNNAEDSALQTAIDWACGPGNTDCSGIQQGGPCYDPSDILKMASYIFNNYYLKNGLADEACNFSNTAAVTSLNPSKSITEYKRKMRIRFWSDIANWMLEVWCICAARWNRFLIFVFRPGNMQFSFKVTE